MRDRVVGLVFCATVLLRVGISTDCTAEAAVKPTTATEEQARKRAEELDRRYMEIQRELRFREAEPKFRKKFPDLNVRDLETSLQRPKDPVLRAMSLDSLTVGLQTIKLEFERKVELLSYGLGMSKVFLDAPTGWPDPKTRANLPTSAAIVAIIPRSEFDETPGPLYHLNTGNLKVVLGNYLCASDPFYDATNAATEGTGFLIDGARIVTAGHVVGSANWLDSVYFVFDYAWKADGTANVDFDATQVFRGSAVVGRFWDGSASEPRRRDWAVIQLDGDPGRTPLEYRKSGSVATGDAVYMVGHPNGLPQMYVGVGSVVDASDCWQFRVDLDNFTDSSGSPVIHNSTHVAEGVLVWDVGNYLRCDVCSVRGVYVPEYGFAGAKASRTTEFSEWLEHPTSVVLRTEVFYAEVEANGTTYYLSSADPDVEIPGVQDANGDWGITLDVVSGCEAVSDPDVGERWKVVLHEGQPILRRDCFH